MKILVACEESQAVTKELRRLGHEAYSCDLEPCSGGRPEWHLQVDALELIKMKWDMIIAFPPCTKTSNAGACRLYHPAGVLDEVRYQDGLKGKAFFMRFLNADCPKIAVENPIPSRVYNFPKPTQIIQPYQFDELNAHPFTKRTCLWLKGLPPLVPTTPNAQPIGPYVPSWTSRKDKNKYGAAKRGEDAKNRSKTFPGIARAMAEQWAGNTKGGPQ